MPTPKRVRLTPARIEAAMRKPPPVGRTTFLRDDAVRGFAVRIHPTGRANYYLLLPKGQRQAFWHVQSGDLLKRELQLAREYAVRELHPRRAYLSHGYEPEGPSSVTTPIKENPSKFAIDRVFADFTKWYLGEKQNASERYIHDCETRFKRYVLPVWKKGTDVRHITKSDVLTLGRSIIGRTGKRRTAGLTLSLLSTLFKWCMAETLLDRNPAQGVASHLMGKNEGKVKRTVYSPTKSFPLCGTERVV